MVVRHGIAASPGRVTGPALVLGTDDFLSDWRKGPILALDQVILLAHDLTPAETARLDTEHVLGFATEAGETASHTVTLARALEIPAVVGLGSFLADVSPGEIITIDGNRGEVIVNPHRA